MPMTAKEALELSEYENCNNNQHQEKNKTSKSCTHRSQLCQGVTSTYMEPFSHECTTSPCGLVTLPSPQWPIHILYSHRAQWKTQVLGS